MAARLPAFRAKIRKMHIHKRNGINVAQVARAAGTPAAMYGVAVTGIADGPLQQARSVIARASAPEGFGKNPDLILWAHDGLQGTLDPAFDAHLQPVLHWASAWWEHWRPRHILCKVGWKAIDRVKATLSSPWRRTAGPAVALAATLGRIGWTWDSPNSMTTDDGRKMSCEIDPPAAFAQEVKVQSGDGGGEE